MKLEATRCLWAAVIVFAAAAIPAARGIWLDLPSSGTKCVSEELHNNVVVMGDYFAFVGEEYDANNTYVPTMSVKVTSPYGNELHHKEKVSHGQFAFTTTESGNYLACFWLDGDSHGGKKVTVGIDWRTGIATKDWDSVARKEKIEGLELELKKLEGAVEAIHENLNYLITREADMREVSETTNARVVLYSIMSLSVCIGVSIFQLWFLRRYFQKKKLI
ncbi:emp24/gp25L/p24 family of membrane trafficking protein [Handroanthus impetiginosus]|uniref:Emp24/gp25L/p24 family of membrane trafficking protein n=1 Tax=Handroanthus impetiginosus TaxID=429701 RepID=A0A2G9H1M1_9LAMI|nr:emp24/gp25L/p24 family of membrane trafficking protein [Handroanthus impetiginosus]